MTARYARHASANACAFCALLATRGAVYTAQSAVRVTGENLGGRHGYIATCTRDSDGVRSEFDVRDLHVIQKEKTP